MNTKIMTIFTRTPLHVGAGSSVGAIDSPIARERHTHIPVIPGSGLKGVISDLWGDRAENPEAIVLFGNGDSNNSAAGALLIGEAKVLAFPVRSAKNAFAWVTCPLALQRFQRDAGISELDIPAPSEMKCYASNELKINDHVILEEYCFEFIADNSNVVREFKKIFADATWSTVGERLAIISDEMFSFFVENACEVVTRTRIKDKTGTVDIGALFNQEQVPSETMLYTTVGTFKEKSHLEKLVAKLKDNGDLIQVGGDETTGLGVCSVNFINVEEK